MIWGAFAIAEYIVTIMCFVNVPNYDNRLFICKNNFLITIQLKDESDWMYFEY